MKNKQNSVEEFDEFIRRLNQLEGVVMAGMLPGGGTTLPAKCNCQNCLCNSNKNGQCVCNPNCTCQGRTRLQSDTVMTMLLGGAAEMDMSDIETLVELRDKIIPEMNKQS